MVAASELEWISGALACWRAFDPEVKAELSSTGVRLGNKIYLVDPIPLAEPPRAELIVEAAVAEILITNTNHARAAGLFAAETGAPIRASAGTVNALSGLEIVEVAAGERFAERLEIIALDGAAEGEIALHLDDGDGGAIILGDALIHFGSDGFALLPEKYCADQSKLRRSLQQLLDFRFERLLFAHGQPLVTDAWARLEEILRG